MAYVISPEKILFTAYTRDDMVVLVKGPKVSVVITGIQKKEPSNEKIKALTAFAEVHVGKKGDTFIISVVKKVKLEELPNYLYHVLRTIGLDVEPPRDFLSTISYLNILQSLKAKNVNYAIQYKATRPIKIEVITSSKDIADSLSSFMNTKEKKISEKRWSELRGIESASKEKIVVYVCTTKVELLSELFDILKKIVATISH